MSTHTPAPRPPRQSAIRRYFGYIAAETRDIARPAAQGSGQVVGLLPRVLFHYPVAAARAAVRAPGLAVRTFRRQSLRVRLALAAVVLTVVPTLGYLVVSRELRHRRDAQVADAWKHFGEAAAKYDRAAMDAALERVDELAPGDATAAARRRELATGEADPSDQAMVRYLMSDHARQQHFAEAAREANKRIAVSPQAWDARCILAMCALQDGRRDEATDHLKALPLAGDQSDGLTFYILWLAIDLHKKLGLPCSELHALNAVRVVPALQSTQLQHCTVNEKLLLLRCYQTSFEDIDRFPTLTVYWVSAAKLGKQLLDDPNLTTGQLAELAQTFERQVATLAMLRQTGKVAAEDGEALAGELAERDEKAWKLLRQRDPQSPVPYLGLAAVAARHNDLPAAEAVLHEGIAGCGEKPQLLVELSNFLLVRDPEAALRVLVRAQENGADEAAIAQKVAEAAFASARPDIAVAVCRKAREAKPDLPWACIGIARFHTQQEQPTQALEALAPVDAFVTRNAECANITVRSLAALGADARLDAFLQRVRKDGTTEGLLGAALALRELGRFEEAVQWCETVLQSRPDHKGAQKLLAESLQLLTESAPGDRWDVDKVRQVLAACERLRKHDPDNLPLANNMAWLYAKALGNGEEAFKASAPLRASESTLPPPMLSTLGAVYLLVGKPDDARRVLEAAAGSPGPKAEYYLQLARAYAVLRRPTEAQHCLERAAALPRAPREAAEAQDIARLLRGATP
jgi:tetratricopeptide (TPR) repeat protein